MRYGIVGFGAAGYHGLKAIRQYDRSGQVDVYCDTGLAPCNPMLTTYYVSGKLSHEDMFPFGSLETIQSQENFQYRKEKVTRIHAVDRGIETDQGIRYYDRILVTTGARAVEPPVKGAAKEDIFLMRTPEDARRLKERLEQGNVRSALVIGASMVGIKVVELLDRNGIRTCLADLAPCIFPLAAYPDVAEVIGRRIEAQGIRLCFSATVDHMEQRESGSRAIMTDGTEVSADVVILCIGTRAATELVQGEVVIGRGILVNERMETSAPGIYAAGDCCEGKNLENGQTQIIGLWANAIRQGTTAGTNMAGGQGEFGGNILHNITHFMNMDFIGFGNHQAQGEILEHGSLEKGLFIRLVCRDGQVAGANILDNFRISGIVKNYMLRLFAGESPGIPEYQRGMLIKAGITGEFIDKIERTIYGQSGTVIESKDSL